MARKRNRSKPKRRTKYKSAVNVTNLGIGAVSLTAFSQSMFGLAPLPFLLGGYVNTYSASGGTSTAITLKEILSGGNFGSGGTVIQDLPKRIGDNLKANAVPLVGTLVGVRIFKKLLSASGAARIANKNIRMIGLGNLIKF